ncbi:MAG: YdcF family protein [Bacteroidia bacterium]|nr:YdcF family protein [Bacteroidia bacterium]
MKKKIILFFTISFLLLLISIVGSNYWVIHSTRSQLYSEVDTTPQNDIGLLLGANKKSSRGGDNLYFKNRIKAASDLFKAGKIKHIIVSGDNHIKEYDEATDMCDALIWEGVPDSCITLDYAGFRTFDSMVRCLKVFKQKNVTVISQEFHNQRAVFIGNYYEMNVIGFNAKDVPAKYSIKTAFREYFAKLKAVLDLYVFHTEPKFLGEEVKIKI